MNLARAHPPAHPPAHPRARLALCALVVPWVTTVAVAQSTTAGRSADWPVYGGNTDNSHFTTLGQISPANVARLKVAWTYDTHDAFSGSEMQANPIVIDGVLYATTPKLHVFALNAATGKELWRFDPNNGAPPTSRIRHRGVVVTGDRVIFNYRNRLYALDRATGKPITSFGTNGNGWVDLRAGLGRPVEGLSVSASTPGVVFDDLLIIGSSVPEALPSAPGDIRAFDIKTGALRWSFHTIPHPGEFGYNTWMSPGAHIHCPVAGRTSRQSRRSVWSLVPLCLALSDDAANHAAVRRILATERVHHAREMLAARNDRPV